MNTPIAHSAGTSRGNSSGCNTNTGTHTPPDTPKALTEGLHGGGAVGLSCAGWQRAGYPREKGSSEMGEVGCVGWRWDGDLPLFKLLPCSVSSLLIWQYRGRHAGETVWQQKPQQKST